MWIKRPRMADSLMDDRIVDAINAQLTAKGGRWFRKTQTLAWPRPRRH
jgi:hypothetical protein